MNAETELGNVAPPTLIAKAGGELAHAVGGSRAWLQDRFGREDRLVDAAAAEVESLAAAIATVLHSAARHQVELMEPVALDQLPGEAQLARSGSGAAPLLVNHHAVRLALGRGVEEQDIEVAYVVGDGAEDAAAQCPVAEAKAGEQAVVEALRIVLGPFRAEIAPPLEFGREISACGEDDRTPLLAAIVLPAPEGDDLEILGRAPARDSGGG